jgi:hypothetical protein
MGGWGVVGGWLQGLGVEGWGGWGDGLGLRVWEGLGASTLPTHSTSPGLRLR